jgi:uncharacterized protein YdeI (YjbR/CyaY-like superfamily)
MAAVKVNPANVHEFADLDAFASWLAAHHDKVDEVWIKLHKVKSGLPSITPKEAIDVALCWGWIDAIRKSCDANSYLQRYTPRRPRSIWSRINVENVERLVAERRMTEHGLREVEAAKKDGRWERAYAGGREMELPEELAARIDADPAAKATYATLSAQNRYALAFRLHNLKTAAARERKIGEFVAMLREGRTIYPQRKK